MKLHPFSKTFDGVKVLDFPGLELKPGTIYAVIGANGGKSTFAKILAGVLKADQGGKHHDAESLGYMPQKNYAFRMSTRKNLLLYSFLIELLNSIRKTSSATLSNM